jgi:hypothetical protein
VEHRAALPRLPHDQGRTKGRGSSPESAQARAVFLVTPSSSATWGIVSSGLPRGVSSRESPLARIARTSVLRMRASESLQPSAVARIWAPGGRAADLLAAARLPTAHHATRRRMR